MAAIFPLYEVFYIESLLFNTTSALASATWFSSELNRLAASDTDEVDETFNSEDMLDNLQNIIVQGAAVSRYFWPVRSGHEARAEQLRAAFDVDDASPLRSRDLRNAIEHFDERLDKYLAEGIVGRIVPHYFGTTQPSGGVPLHLFRGYYLDVGEFELLGDRFVVQSLVDELSSLHAKLRFCLENGGRLLPRRM
jgi:hypothetical protein